MSSVRVLLLLFLISLSFSSSKSRLLDKMASGDDRDKAVSESSVLTEEVSKTSIQKQKIIDRDFDSKQFSNAESRALMESARNMFKQSVQRQEIIGKFFDSKRTSPGGPNPHHHYVNLN